MKWLEEYYAPYNDALIEQLKVMDGTDESSNINWPSQWGLSCGGADLPRAAERLFHACAAGRFDLGGTSPDRAGARWLDAGLQWRALAGAVGGEAAFWTREHCAVADGA